MRSSATEGDKIRLVPALLLTTASMGLLDAVCLSQYQTFTGYMTGTIILLGIQIATGGHLAAPGLTALVAFLFGGIVGGRSMRRTHPTPRLVGEILSAVALLVAAAAALQGFVAGASVLATVALLGFAMGLQMSATRHAGVVDMTMPAVTMVLHGLAHDSRWAGGDAARSRPRMAILASLFSGAIVGILIANYHIWLAFCTSSSLIGIASALLFIWPDRRPVQGPS